MRCLFSAILLCAAVFAAQTAQADTLSWAFQSTGFRTTKTGSVAQTAVALRDGAWPVIFAPSSDSSYSTVQAYSLYPVKNTVTNTNWHQIGANVLYMPSSDSILSAATSSDGRIAATVHSASYYNNDLGNGVVFGSSGGFSGFSARAVTFSDNGTLVKGTTSTLPQTVTGVSGNVGTLVDIAVAPGGDLAAIDDAGNYYQRLAATGNWVGTSLLDYSGGYPGIASYSDLVMDSLGRPHVTFGGGIADFDIRTGTWTKQQLVTSGAIAPMTVAADSRGGIGVAWTQGDMSGQNWAVEYAYRDLGGEWSTYMVTSNIFNYATSQWDAIVPQRLGLVFDGSDLPVISFAAQGGNGLNVYLAYDPPVATPEPSSLLLLASGGVLLLVAARRRNCK